MAGAQNGSDQIKYVCSGKQYSQDSPFWWGGSRSGCRTGQSVSNEWGTAERIFQVS